MTSVVARKAGSRLAFVLWNGRLGGAETFVASLARVMRTSNVDAGIVFVGNKEPLAERLIKADVPFVALGFGRGRAAVWHPRALASAVGHCGADGVVLPAGGFLAGVLRVGGYRGRIVAVEHGSLLQTGAEHRRPSLIERLDALVGSLFVDVHVAVSDFLRERMQRRAVVTIPNGVDLDLYRPPSTPRADGVFAIGCMSRLIPGKGVDKVIVAVRPALARGARLRIAGDGPMRSELERLAGQLGLRESVEFHGWIRDAADVARFWWACDVAITAPDDWVEAFGLVAVEAMSCGRPVIATSGGALAETVLHGETGFLVAPGDTEALSRALLEYLDDPSLVARHGRAARAWCEQQFDIRRCARDYVGLFDCDRAPDGHRSSTTEGGSPQGQATPESMLMARLPGSGDARGHDPFRRHSDVPERAG
jgi:glycosyltransferase involved in cell wall biosynthesis